MIIVATPSRPLGIADTGDGGCCLGIADASFRLSAAQLQAFQTALDGFARWTGSRDEPAQVQIDHVTCDHAAVNHAVYVVIAAGHLSNRDTDRPTVLFAPIVEWQQAIGTLLQERFSQAHLHPHEATGFADALGARRRDTH